MIYIALAIALLALLPAAMVFWNLQRFHAPAAGLDASATAKGCPRISVLIPARDEAGHIARSVEGALHSRGVDVEVVVLDDDSQDATADVVQAIAGRDTRVRLVRGEPLPPDWNGKQHACWQLATVASHPLLVFMDADVRLAPDALARLSAERQATGVALLSAFPHQETGTFWEHLLIPLMHYILLGFLPLDRMRRSTDPALAAGCGQLFLTERRAYDRAGSHAAIRLSRHDGLMLPRAYRRAGLTTDVCDGTAIASCRMYHGAGEVFRGLLKNATEGIANPRLIGPFSVLLLGASIAPPVGLAVALLASSGPAIALLGLACAACWLPRWMCARAFGQSRLGVLLHPLAVGTFVVIQWTALVYAARGHRVAWRGRVES